MILAQLVPVGGSRLQGGAGHHGMEDRSSGAASGVGPAVAGIVGADVTDPAGAEAHGVVSEARGGGRTGLA